MLVILAVIALGAAVFGVRRSRNRSAEQSEQSERRRTGRAFRTVPCSPRAAIARSRSRPSMGRRSMRRSLRQASTRPTPGTRTTRFPAVMTRGADSRDPSP